MTSYGCSTQPVVMDDLPPIPASLLQPCPPLPPLENGQLITAAKLLLTDAEFYEACRGKHEALISTLKFREKLFNSHKE